MPTITMKLAKATAADESAMILLTGILSDVFEVRPHEGPQYPRGLDGAHEDDAPHHFDPDNNEHLRALYDRLAAVIGPHIGAMNRILFGYTSLTHPDNQLVDPELDTLAFHPRLVSAEIDKRAIAREAFLLGFMITRGKFNAETPAEGNAENLSAPAAASDGEFRRTMDANKAFVNLRREALQRLFPKGFEEPAVAIIRTPPDKASDTKENQPA